MTLSQTDSAIILEGKYRLEARLGEGATGVVYRALHLGLKKTFAVKLLKTGSLDPFALARFRREAEALGQLRHPHVVEVTDFGIDAEAGVAYLVLELLDGSTLADVCRTQGPVPLDRALPLLEAIAAAVDAAHAQGILHRDLKPGNVLLCPAPEGGPLVKVLDFGLAEIAGVPPEEDLRPHDGMEGEGRLTSTGSLLGTPLYVAPELIRQQPASRASDLYSFGVIAYELLAGHPPFQGSTAEVLAGHLDREPPAPELPEEVWQVLQEPLRKDPAERPASAGEIVRRLRQAAEREALARWRAAERPRRAWLAAGLSGIVLVAGLFLPWPVVPKLDHWVQDLRVRSMPARPPDPRIVLVTLDEGPPLADRADEIGATLGRVFQAGARGVAIDLILHETWSKAPAFSDLVLRHPEMLTLAAFSEPNGRVVGTDCVAGLTAAALGPSRTLALFGFVNIDQDADGVTRRGRLRYRDQSGTVRPSWAGRAAETLGAPQSEAANAFWIDARIDWTRYRHIAWHDLPAALDRTPRIFRDRLVLVGAGFEASGDDIHSVPRRLEHPEVVSGLMLQALLIDTIAAGFPVREPDRRLVLAAVVLSAGLALAALLRRPRAGPVVAGLAVAAALYLGLSFPAFWWGGWILPVSSPLLLPLSGLSLALLVRRRLPPAPGGLAMSMLRPAGLCLLLCFLGEYVSAEGTRDSAAPVALVYWLQGEATLTAPSEEGRPLRLFDRLPAGAAVEAGPGSRLALAFANGRRYELGERSRAVIGPSDLASRSGSVRSLAQVPLLPRLLPIADEEKPGLRAGAVRIRAERITGLYPRGGAATLAGATVLRFEPVEGGGKYRVEVQDRQGNLIFADETTSFSVAVPARVLQPGVRYDWTVRTVARVGPVVKEEAGFVTLSAGLAEKRETLRRAVEKAGDGASLALLAEVDRSLGMLIEARDGLRAAVERLPGDAALAEELAVIEEQLEDDQSVPPEKVVIEAIAPGSAAERPASSLRCRSAKGLAITGCS